MNFQIVLTLSKIMAFLMLGCAVYLDAKNGTGIQAFMYACPFVVFLITGKMVSDYFNKK